MDIKIEPMTREQMHEMYQAFQMDPMIFDDMFYHRFKCRAVFKISIDAALDRTLDRFARFNGCTSVEIRK